MPFTHLPLLLQRLVVNSVPLALKWQASSTKHNNNYFITSFLSFFKLVGYSRNKDLKH